MCIRDRGDTVTQPVDAEVAPIGCEVDNGGCAQLCTAADGVVLCDCEPGYELAQDGVSCHDIDECVDAPCLNGGACTDGVASFSCECVPGYSGETCETDIDECVDAPCLNGGTCADGVASFSCECAPGYSGETCEADIDECADAPCLNGGTCTDGVASFSCECMAGYSGEVCETDIDECADAPCLNGCLLYTSPSPRDRTRSRMPSSA